MKTTLKKLLQAFSPAATLRGKRGFVLFLVCTLALVMMIMIIGLSSHKSGAVLQLNRTIEQERVVLLAQAGINEMLATVKAGVNDRNSTIGSRIQSFWKSKPGDGARVVYKADFPASALKLSNKLVDEYLGKKGEVSGQVSIIVTERVNAPGPSYIGHVELIGKARYKDIPAEIRVKERREIKIVDLADPFTDKYALFVKSFCRSLNSPKKRIIVQGVTPDDPTRYSFVYLGNRSYPSCPEFPQGARSAKTPPVLLDLDFKEDRRLLGGFYKPGSFQTINSQYAAASNGNLFFVNPPFPFSTISGSFSPASDFHKTPELVNIYKSIIDSSKDYSATEGSLGYVIAKDYQKSGGNPANSDIFRSLVSSLMHNWKYFYGYSDYASIMGSGGKSFTDEHPFSGISEYFHQIKTANPQRVAGGKMPLLFGEGRDIPVYVEGPVHLRFFKIAFVDEISISFNLHGGNTLDVPFPPVPMHYENPAETFSGKQLSPPVDKRTDRLMSMPIEHFSINNFFFGAGATAAKTPTAVKSGIEGYDVFPAFDESLRTVSHFYQTTDQFISDRIKNINGKKTLDLDGVLLIVNSAGKPLDLSSVQKYTGRGRIIMDEGHCHIGNLSPVDSKNDSLGIYLMSGRFVIKSDTGTANIYASLAATSCFSDNSSVSSSSEGGIEFDGKSVNIFGNLMIDNLFEMRNLPDGGHLKVVHNPRLYFPDYPVRVSIGETRSLLAVDYNAE
ncbi:MAG: hypothetical protein PHD82_07475 [Candidatus Riflebacteria bacterium]|nr:hypothetical protein [Candidatus Riflebacteria bacterium]